MQLGCVLCTGLGQVVELVLGWLLGGMLWLQRGAPQGPDYALGTSGDVNDEDHVRFWLCILEGPLLLVNLCSCAGVYPTGVLHRPSC